MANKAIFHVFMILFLALSHFFFVPSNASRGLRSLMEKPDHSLPQQDSLLDVKKDVEEERMVMELNDYPGSGANNRHLPRQQYGRGCVVQYGRGCVVDC